MKSSKGALARRRGLDWERELVNMLRAYGFDAERVITEPKYGNIGDVLIHEPCILVQCKAGKQPNLARALDEAEEAAIARGDDWIPLGACKKSLTSNTSSRRISMDLGDFLDLLERAYPYAAQETDDGP
jgi:hypothetical protein